MYRFAKISCQRLFSIVLSLSSPAIYAEVPGQAAAPAETAVDSAIHGQSLKDSAVAWELRAEQWELTRSGETILSLPVLNQVVNTWLSDKQKMIEIQYPGGEDGCMN